MLNRGVREEPLQDGQAICPRFLQLVQGVKSFPRPLQRLQLLVKPNLA